MTEQQKKFLIAISDEPKTAKQICNELGIEGNENDPLGGYYNALNEYIEYLTSEEPSEIEKMFEILPSSGPICDNDIYAITSKGKEYLKRVNLL